MKIMYQTSSPHLYPLNSVVSPKRSRSRGVILSQHGWHKLMQAKVLSDRWGNRYSYEFLAGQSLLDTRTVSRILSCEVKVDKRTLKIFFHTFDLPLDADDYTTPEFYSAAQPITRFTPSLNAPASNAEMQFSHEELVDLYQRLMQDLRHLSNLLNLDKENNLVVHPMEQQSRKTMNLNTRLTATP
jgi:hypothetical protein